MKCFPILLRRAFTAIQNALTCLTLAVAAATAAPASTARQTQILMSEAQDMRLVFDGLRASDGTGGTITIASGHATLLPGGEGEGLDLDSWLEFFHLSLEGMSRGLYSCASGAGLTTIPGATIDNALNCRFSLVLTLDGAALDALNGDGNLSLGVLFSKQASDTSQGDEVIVTLSYTDAIAPVSLPAGLPPIVGGVVMSGLVARHRRLLS